MTRLFITAILVAIFSSTIAQNETCLTGNNLPALSQWEEKQLMSLPELSLPERYRSMSLPSSVDNSTQPYFRPVFNQSGYCCGQASGIAYNFTYEVDRVRSLPANIPDNQYPTHFSWNWWNSGYGYYGVSYLHSFRLLKKYGMPNVTDYGGTLAYGGEQRWMSGYNEYYNGMHNRINNAYQIYVGDPDGLETLKHWLYDHLEGSPVGGVASFYAQYMSPQAQLPAGTPEAGKWVIISFGGSPNHAMTIVGYNDSIRYDYNGDGQYTNHIDINNDGTVNMKDWEIGGFKMANSYGGVPNWGNQGFAYMMYKTVADKLGSGGIWNHCVHVLDAKQNCNPQLTMKVTLKHDCREQIKVRAGLNTDIIQSFPEILLEFPMFDYQGACMYMQGGNSVEENKTIEFGLDITSLLSYINSGDTAKFFLQVQENDPYSQGSGEIVSYSLMDYTSGSAVEIPCQQNNVPLVNNGKIYLAITTPVTFDKVQVSNTVLPPVQIGQPYYCQMIATGGEAPYRWFLDKTYDEQTGAGAFPMINQVKLNPSNNTSGFVSRDIDFSFPFYDSAYSRITVHVDGYLMFDEQLYPYPYFNDDMVLFTRTRHISPFMTEELKIYTSLGDGIWYEGDSQSATFRWKCHLEDDDSKEVNVAVKLFPDGKIQYFYGNITAESNLFWIPGIADGNDEHYQLCSNYNDGIPNSGDRIILTPYIHPEGLSLSEEGLLSGIVTTPYNATELKFRVEDNNFINNYKTLTFSTTGIIVLDSLFAGGDNILDYSDTASISVDILNIESDTIQDANMIISSNDPYIELTDSTEYLGTLIPGIVKRFDDAFRFITSPSIPDGHTVQINTEIIGNRQSWQNVITYDAHAPLLNVEEIIIADNNGRLDPGDTAEMILGIRNNGSSLVTALISELSSDDPAIEIIKAFDTVPLLLPDSGFYGNYHVIVAESANIGHMIDFQTLFSANRGYTAIDSFNLMIGLTIEDFESGGFTTFAWGFEHQEDWVMEDFFPYEGLFSARSGRITHNMMSSLILDIQVFEEGEVSFFKRVSCEDDENNDNFDYLAFLIDGIEQARWDGETEWTQEEFQVETGYHRLEWRYTKDSTVSRGYDCAWIDYVSLPSSTDIINTLLYEPESVHKLMLPEQGDEDTLYITNSQPGVHQYEILISYNPDTSASQASRNIYASNLMCNIKALYTGSQKTLTLTVYNTSDDDEWVRDIELSFPSMIGVVSATHFTGGSAGDLIYDGSMGYGCTVTWHGDDGSGWGVLKGGETATANITIVVLPEMTSAIELPYIVKGDIYGNDPHEIFGTINIINLGQDLDWIHVDGVNGSIPGNSMEEKKFSITTFGLPDGDYYAQLIFQEQFQNTRIIPVYLTVDHAIFIPEPGLAGGFTVYPNPANDLVQITWTQEARETVSLKVYDVSGKLVNMLINQLPLDPGLHACSWDLKDETGKTVNHGIYFCILELGDKILSQKLIIIPD
ncbi:MAG: T9SS type A sorting domain-containing protein [Bacteroidetes bacterium]|nr:T9SS type A sorting domain-containing protein [Bacteroidota bacterium]